MEQQQTIKKVPILIVLLTGAFVAILNQTLLTTALPHIMRDLQIDASVVQWLQSGFMLVNGIMIPITAFLIERFTTRKLFLSAMGIFGLGTLISSIAPNFGILMTGRILQAAGAGIMMPLMQTILFLIFPVEKRGTAMGMFGLIISFAPAIGPTLSGWLVQQFPWRSLFYVVLPIVAIDLIIAYFILENVTEQKNPKVDILSITLSTIGFGGLLYGFSMAGTHSWGSPHVYISIIIGYITLYYFIRRQLRLEHPILEFRVFQNKVFTLTTALGMISFMSMIGAAVILPVLTQEMLGYSALESGLMLLPGAILMGIMNPVTGRLFDKYGARWLLIIGLIILMVTTFMFAFLNTETSLIYLATVNGVRMIGISMIMMPATTAGINQLKDDLIPHGTAMNNTMRQVAGSVGTALLVTIMINQEKPELGVEGAIHGVNVSFVFAGIFAIIAFVLALFIRDKDQVARRI